MAFRRGWRMLIAAARSARDHSLAKTNVGFCVGCGSAAACYALYGNNQYRARTTSISDAFQPVLTPVKCDSTIVVATQQGPRTPDVYQHTREKRFHDFASVLVDGEFFMTPQDFLESVTDEKPRPRVGHMKLSSAEVKSMLARTPSQKKSSSRFFRSLHSNGLVSYTEYLFLLCILTKPKTGFEIAFDMFDVDGNRRVDKREFLVLEEIFRTRTEKQCYDEQGRDRFRRIARDPNTFAQGRLPSPNKSPGTLPRSMMEMKEDEERIQDTTLLVHFFGRNGKDELKYEDFYQFMDNLQTEVLELEFLTYSHGMATISELDFAKVLLRYTDVDDIDEHLEKLAKRIPEEKGISFKEFSCFFRFLNNLEDFQIAMHMYTLAGRSIGQDEFKRAVKISTGNELSENLVNTVFQLFDKDGDGQLSHVEFMGVLKDRIQRGFRSKLMKHEGWSGFTRCMRHNFKQQKQS